MPDPALIDQQPFWGAALALLTGGLLWLWRGFSLGVKIGALAQELKDSRQEGRDYRSEHREGIARIENRLGRMEQRLDGHMDKGAG